MQSPATKVLETYELLEAVLFHLTARELFVLQSVNTKWCSVIARSEILQTTMFLRPQGAPIHPTSLATLDAPRYDIRVRLSPACRIAPDCFSGKAASLSSLATWDGEGGHECPGNMILQSKPAKGMPELLVSIIWREQSKAAVWKRTFLTQPPIEAAVLSVGGAVGRCTLYNHTGLMLGDVFEMKDKVTRTTKHGVTRPMYTWYASFALASTLKTRVK